MQNIDKEYTESLFNYKNVEWSLPFMFHYEYLCKAIFDILNMYGYSLGKVNLYGCPVCAWTGGRPPYISVKIDPTTLNRIFDYTEKLNAVPTFNFTCTELKMDELKDGYSNYLLDMAYERNCRFIVAYPPLFEYIKNKYPNAYVVCSIIQGVREFQSTPEKIKNYIEEEETAFYNEMSKIYDMVVVRPYYSKYVYPKNFGVLEHPEKIEVLINSNCHINCPLEYEHYKSNEKKRYTGGEDDFLDKCVLRYFDKKRLFDARSHSVNLVKKLTTEGKISHLKLQGRGTKHVPTLMKDVLMYIFEAQISPRLIMDMIMVSGKARAEFKNYLEDGIMPDTSYIEEFLVEAQKF